jgi:hypothetical protein
MANFAKSVSGATHIVAAAGGIQMMMLVRSKKEYFKDFIEREAKAKGLKCVINGSFAKLSFLSSVAVRTGSTALDASESQIVGKVIQDGKLIGGATERGRYYFSHNTCEVDRFSVGLDDPPSSSCAAIGGLAPIVSDGLPYGTANLYRAGAPSGAPSVGDVGPKYRPFLTQKSNAMYRDILNRGSFVGKTAIGFSRQKNALLILSQQDGTSGLNADEIRYVFVKNNVENAVFLDCSDSATLYYDGKFVVEPGDDKNEFLTVAIGFK